MDDGGGADIRVTADERALIVSVARLGVRITSCVTMSEHGVVSMHLQTPNDPGVIDMLIHRGELRKLCLDIAPARIYRASTGRPIRYCT